MKSISWEDEEWMIGKTFEEVDDIVNKEFNEWFDNYEDKMTPFQKEMFKAMKLIRKQRAFALGIGKEVDTGEMMLGIIPKPTIEELAEKQGTTVEEIKRNNNTEGNTYEDFMDYCEIELGFAEYEMTTAELRFLINYKKYPEIKINNLIRKCKIESDTARKYMKHFEELELLN